MNGLLTIEFSNHLVAALLHTLWQGAVIAGALWLVLRALPARQARTRYAACVIAMLAIVIAFSVTWKLIAPPAGVPLGATAATSTWTITSPNTAAPAVSPSFHEVAKARKPVEGIAWMRVAAGLWMLGVLVMLARMARSVVGAGRLRRRCVPIEEPSMLLLLDVVRLSMRVARRVRLAVSEQITSPAVIGIVWPTILLPLSVVTGTDAQTLRMILAHELAHVRRHDYLVNLLQLLIESVLFFNPAVWWISRQIRIEREACCDARAIAAGVSPSDYVKTLASFAETLAQPQASAAMAMSGGQQSGGLLDRVRRALLPSHRPGLRLPWYSLTGAMIVGALVLASVWRTSVAAVELAEKLLTPEERIEKSKEARKEYSPAVSYSGKMVVKGSVKTADGKKIPAGTYGNISIVNPNSSMSRSMDINDSGTFSYEEGTAGNVTVWVTAPGYVPASIGPVAPTEQGKLDPFDLVLTRGFIATFRVVDSDGKPVSGASISGGYKVGNSATSGIDLKTDSDGTATMDTGAELPLSLSVDISGFEPAKFEGLKCSRNEPVELKIKRAEPMNGVVTDKETGKPLAAAKIRIARVVGPNPKTDLDENRAPAAQTDAQGRFSLTSLRSDSVYTLWVAAAKHGHELVPNVTAGQKDLAIKLGRGIVYKGKVVGALERLEKNQKGERYVTYSIQRTIDNSGWSTSAKALVTIKGGEGTFEIEDLWPGNMNISVPGEPGVTFNVDGSRDDILLDLSATPEKPKPAPKRTVVFTFNTPDGAPPPTGTIRINATKSLPGNGLLQIKDGKATMEIETPAQVGYKPVGLNGYWFKEDFGKEVPDGDEPLEIPLDVRPAGAIFGKITGAVAGKDLPGQCMLSIVTEKSAGENVRVDTDERAKPDGKFYIGTIPLGGSYRVVAHIDKQFAISDSIELDESQPLREIELNFAEGVTVECLVVDANDQPIHGMPVDFNANMPSMSFGFSPLLTTDASGKIRFEHVVPDIGVGYLITCTPKRDYQPFHDVVDFTKLPIRMKLEKGLVQEGVLKNQATGEPVRGMVVKARPEYRSGPSLPTLEAEGPTNEKGEFRFSNLLAGEWNLQVDDWNRVANFKPMKVTVSEENTPVDLSVELRPNK